MNTPEATNLLETHKPHLTKQQYRTIRGQLRAGDVEGAMKGLQKLIGKKVSA